MSVSCDLPAQRGFALDLPPSLRERQKKTLFATQSADHDIGLAFQREDIGVMRHQQARQIGDIFIQDLLAIHAKIGKRAVAVKLRRQFRRRRVILRQVFGGPPMAETALSVVNIAEFVEAVADFVGDAGAGGAVVGGGVALASRNKAAEACRRRRIRRWG